MKAGLTIWIAVAALCGAATLAQARPPTVTPSPGYDARLQESRSALSSAPSTVAPATGPAATPKRTKKKHTN